MEKFRVTGAKWPVAEDGRKHSVYSFLSQVENMGIFVVDLH